MCFHLQSLHLHDILTVTEGFILGLFFIQAPHLEWVKANTKTFLNYNMFDTKKDATGISFSSGSLHQKLFFTAIFLLLVHMIIYLHNVAASYMHFKSN